MNNKELPLQKQQAIIEGHKRHMSEHKIAEIVGLSIQTVRKYLKLFNLTPMSKSEAVHWHSVFLKHKNKEIEQYKHYIETHFNINKPIQTEDYGYCKECGCRVSTYYIGNKCPKCQIGTLIFIDVITNLARDWSIY
jgi:predicted transcriptional regulator